MVGWMARVVENIVMLAKDVMAWGELDNTEKLYKKKFVLMTTILLKFEYLFLWIQLFIA